MKMYKKSKLTLANGVFVTKKGKVVYPGDAIVEQMNRLEDYEQKAQHLKAQPKPQPERSLDGFEREHSMTSKGHRFTCDTPEIDKAVQQTMNMLLELDDMEECEKGNKILDEFAELIEWAAADEFVGVEADEIKLIDTPTLGDPLTWEEETVGLVAAGMLGFELGED